MLSSACTGIRTCGSFLVLRYSLQHTTQIRLGQQIMLPSACKHSGEGQSSAMKIERDALGQQIMLPRP